MKSVLIFGADKWRGRPVGWAEADLTPGRSTPVWALRRLLLQRRFPGLRRRAGLWNQPAYSRNQESESSSPRERVAEKSVPEKHASEAAAVESKTESKHKTGRSRKKRHRGD